MALDPTQPPRTGRVKVSAPVNDERSKKLSLTLIGRVTNRTTQKVWSLIPFFTELWKADGRPVGSDLGNGLFQFQFEKEADLNAVLERRPYHYAHWMIILQRWEPTTATSFPSLIPFWIKVQGIPLHLWSEQTLETLAEDFGIFEKAEITDFTLRMRVQVNGLLPLVKSSIIEYPNGDEVTASFVYERIEKHCSKCFRLDHEVKDCLVAKHQARELKAQEQSSNVSVMDIQRKDDRDRDRLSRNSELYRFSATKATDSRRDDQAQRPDSYRREDRKTGDDRNRSRSYQDHSSHRSYKEPPKDWRSRLHRPSSDRYTPVHRSKLIRDDARHLISSRNRNNHIKAARERTSERREDSVSSKIAGSNDDRGIPPPPPGLPPQLLTINEALGNVREAMLQLTRCTDPLEVTARQENTQRADDVETCVFAQRNVREPILGGLQTSSNLTATRRLSVSQRIGTQEYGNEGSNERLPATQRLGGLDSTAASSEERRALSHRLGPLAPDPPSSERIPANMRLGQQETLADDGHGSSMIPPKRKPGRPPGSKATPKPTAGSTPKRRKTKGAKPSPVRRTSATDPATGRTKPLTGTSRASRKPTNSKPASTTSDNQPICNMIPASTRRRVDFHNPSTLGP